MTLVGSKSLPLILRDWQVLAILQGHMTQYRVPVTDTNTQGNICASGLKLDEAWIDKGPSPAGNHGPYLKAPAQPWAVDDMTIVERLYPRTQPGDRWWVREAWGSGDKFLYDGEQDPPRVVIYRADGAAINYVADDGGYSVDTSDWGLSLVRWRSPVSMPKWASRLTIEVTGVRLERAQEISAEDAVSEGVKYEPVFGNWAARTEDAMPSIWKARKENERRAIEAFFALWNSTYEKKGLGFDTNPWTLVYEFRVVQE